MQVQAGAWRESDDVLRDQFRDIRSRSLEYCRPLTPEDHGLQAAAETSPPKWHLAHTTWFFETFILRPFADEYRPFNAAFEYLFNSYYNGVGEQFPRPERGLLSRPTLEEVHAWRRQVDEAVQALLACTDHPEASTIRERVVLGLHHEQQHQELFFTDLKYSFSRNPLYPVYTPVAEEQTSPARAAPLRWHEYAGGIAALGSNGDREFIFDNEAPRHRVFLEPFALASRPVTNGEFLAFVDDGGYRRPELWLADGWAHRNAHGWQAPLYWVRDQGHWYEYRLHGLLPLDLNAPVCHLSGYEADAFARWYGARLPTEAEWEHVAATQPVDGHFVDRSHYQPLPATGSGEPEQLFGTVWEWTASAYAPYPGYRPAPGALGEYNGKFMCNQWVLRGGSCVSDRRHIRSTYRNFFYPPDRWQFSGLRLARDQGTTP